MKSFKDYIKIRSALVSEMAVAPIKRGDKELRSHVKTPVQFDRDDINFLKQFPPEFWAQALNRRYSILLYQTYELHQEGKRMPENFDVEVIGKGGTRIRFPVKNAKMNDLYEELDGAEDATRYSQLNVDDLADEDSIRKKYYSNPDGSERSRITIADGREKKLSKYGFDLEDLVLKSPTKGNPFYEGHAKGYVVPGKVVCREIIQQATNHLDQGWHDDEIEGTRGEVYFGGDVGGRGKSSGKTKNLPIVPGSEGTTWAVTGITRNGKKVLKTFSSAIPDIQPGYHVDASTRKQSDEYLEISKELNHRISSRNFDDYINLLSDNFKNNPGFEDLDIIDKKEIEKLNYILSSKGLEKKELIRTKKLLEFSAYLDDEKNKKEFINLYKTLYKISDSEKTALVNTIQKTLEKVVDFIHQKRIDVIKNAKRYNVHQWNALKHSRGRSPHGNLVQIGAVWEPLGQQVGVYYQILRDIFENNDENVNLFWNHLANDLQLISICKAGARESIESQRDINRVITPGSVDIEGLYIRSLKEAMIENIDSIAENALEQFLNKSGNKGSAVAYAKYFKEKVIDDQSSIESLLQDKKVKRFLNNVGQQTQAESKAYAFQVWQLQKRFLHRRYDRDQTRRPENPHENVSNLSLLEIIEKFHSGDAAIQDLAPGRTSHAIATLQAAADARGITNKDLDAKASEIQTLIQSSNFTQKGKGSVNKDDGEKSMNKGIFVSTVEKVRKALGSTLGSAAKKVSGAVGGSLEKLRSIIGSKKIQQSTENQPAEDQTQANSQKSSSSSMDRLKSILGRRTAN